MEAKISTTETNQPLYMFNNPEKRLLGKSLVDSLNTTAGDQYILRPTNQNNGTHFYVNRLLDNKMLGCYKVGDFQIISEFNNEKELLEHFSNSVTKELEEESSFESIEQLCLF